MSANPRSVARTLIVVVAALCEVGVICSALALHQNLLLVFLIVPPLLAAAALDRSYRADRSDADDEANAGTGGANEQPNAPAEEADARADTARRESEDEPEPEALRFLARPVPRAIGLVLVFAIIAVFFVLIRWAMQKYVG